MKHGRAEPALDRLVAEAKREPLPDVDWDAVEASLLRRLGEAPRYEPLRQRSYRTPVALALAAAALLGAAAAFFVGGPVPHAPSQAIAPAFEAENAPATGGGAVDGNALAVGAAVRADADCVVVEHTKHATWKLEPGSLAHVEQLGSVVRIALDRGSVSARVVKSPQPESFVVRVEGTRVAVHGTAFRVVRLGNTVRVEVTEGVVGVGPVGGPSFEVAAPSIATTTLAGVRVDSRHASRDTGPKSAERPHPSAVAAAEPEPAPEGSAVAEPAEPSGEAPQVSARAPRASSSTPNTDGIVQAVRRCFREHTVTSGGVEISVSTQMSLRIEASGRVGEAVFTPPLAPGVRRCVDDTVGAMKFDSSPDGFAVVRVLELER